MKIGETEIKWLGHSGILIKNSKIIIIDPYQISENIEKADAILITHNHYDHCSIEDIQKITKPGTIIICPADCQSKITKLTEQQIELNIIHPGDSANINSIKIDVVPAYNLDKPFHPKQEEWCGYIIKINETIIYHAGDTDKIPEMQNLTGHSKKENFIALLPIGGKYTMDAEEAAEAALIIKPTLAIPIHYGSIIGDQEDAQEFVNLCQQNTIKHHPFLVITHRKLYKGRVY